MNMPQLIVGVDLNLTLHHCKTWGSQARHNPLSNYFLNIIEQHLLVNIEPIVIVIVIELTWANHRASPQNKSKCLDCLLVSKSILLYLSAYRSTVLKVTCSDHAPIMLELSRGIKKTPYPFKFHPHWLLYEDFKALNPSTTLFS